MTPLVLGFIESLRHTPQLGSADSVIVALLVFCALLQTIIFFRGSGRTSVSSKPDLVMKIDQINWEEGTKGNTVLIFAVNLLNRGAPTVTTGWGGNIKFGFGSIEDMTPFHLSGSWKLINAEQCVTLYPKDQIRAKTMERRLETGEAKMGRIFFNISGDRIDQLKGANFTAKVYCFDFLGQRAEGIFVPHGAPLSGVSLYPDEEGSFAVPRPPESASGAPELEPPKA